TRRSSALVLATETRELRWVLQGEQPSLRRSVSGKAVVAVEMVEGDVGQRGRIAAERKGEIDLVARQLQDVRTAFRQRLLRENGQTDVAAHQSRPPGIDKEVVQERRRGRFAVGACDADDLVRRRILPRLREQLDIPDQRNTCLAGFGSQ